MRVEVGGLEPSTLKLSKQTGIWALIQWINVSYRSTTDKRGPENKFPALPWRGSTFHNPTRNRRDFAVEYGPEIRFFEISLYLIDMSLRLC
jgi:hypothetical protein